MTILNCWITPERALIGTDTEMAVPCGAAPEGKRAQCTKLLPLVHLNAVLACRGEAIFFKAVFDAINLSGGDDLDAVFDAMAGALPGLLSATRDGLRMGGVTHATIPDSQTIVLVGWSPRAGRIVGVEWTQETSARGFVADDINPHYIAPWNRSIEPFADPTTPETMMQLARKQVRLMRERAPGAAAGGKLILAELTRDAMTIGSAGEL